MYYIIRKSDRHLIRTSPEPFSTLINETETEIQLQRVDDNTQPEYNSGTQRLNRTFVDNDVAFTRTFYWEVVALTQGELDAIQQKADDDAENVTIQNVLQNMWDGAGTQADRMQRVERTVVRMAQRLLRKGVL